MPSCLVLDWAKFQGIYGEVLIGLAAYNFYLTEFRRWLQSLIMLTKNIAMQYLYVFSRFKSVISWSLHSSEWLLLSLSKVVQATSNQMSKRDPLRPCMDIINNMLTRMVWILRYHIKFHLEIETSHNNSLPQFLFFSAWRWFIIPTFWWQIRGTWHGLWYW